MVKIKRTDEELAELFREMPSITDRRSMDEIYGNVMENMNRYGERKKRRFLWPSLATAAVLFLAFILGSSLLNTPDRNLDQGIGQEEAATDDNATIFRSSGADDLNDHRSTSQDRHVADGDGAESISLTNGKTAVYEEMVDEDETAITLYIPDNESQNIVPVTVIEKQAPGETWLDLFNDVMERIDEEKLGLSDFYPYSGTLTFDEKGNVMLDLKSEVKEKWGTNGETMFMRSLDSFKNQKIDRIYLYDNGSPGVFLPHAGETVYEHETDRKGEGYGYLIYQNNDRYYLTPGPNSHIVIEKAFDEMKEKNDVYGLEPSIPREIRFTVDTGPDGELIVRFGEETEIDNGQSAQWMIEAILLTAKDFDYSSVRFENFPTDVVNGFDLEKPVQVPVGPNMVQMWEE